MISKYFNSDNYVVMKVWTPYKTFRLVAPNLTVKEVCSLFYVGYKQPISNIVRHGIHSFIIKSEEIFDLGSFVCIFLNVF